MAPVIWGLDLKEMQWWKFKSSYMFGNKDYHLRRTKFVVYQLAMILGVVAESVGTAALEHYVSQQDFIQNLNNDAIVHNDDFVGIASYNIFCGIFVAFVFGGAFFFDLFWPERKETPGVRLAWRICAVMSVLGVLGGVIAMTVIVSSRGAYITGVDAAEATQLLILQNGDPLEYKRNGRCVTSLVFLWLGFAATIASCVVMWMYYDHYEKVGPFADHVANRPAETKSVALDEEASTMNMNDLGRRSSEPATDDHPYPAEHSVSSSPPRIRPFEQQDFQQPPAKQAVYSGT